MPSSPDPTTLLARLEATIAARSAGDPSSSYVASLHAKGRGKMAQKVGEEATEVVIAALTGSREALVGETADLVFHLLVLLGARVFRGLPRRPAGQKTPDHKRGALEHGGRCHPAL
jgi:phosphoribosyl-ATP pyrophosphohydrolase